MFSYEGLNVGVISNLLNALTNQSVHDNHSFLHAVIGGSMYKMSDLKGQTDVQTIKQLITTMRALACDSQVSTALSYYATDATTPNSSGDIIWAVDVNSDSSRARCADLVNALLKRWNVNTYARDHVLELATVGNLYIPTTEFKREVSSSRSSSRMYIGLDRNDIPDDDYDIISSHKISPESIVHIWSNYEPCGYLYDPSEDSEDAYLSSDMYVLPETSVIHFSLGGLIGKYSYVMSSSAGEDVEFDIQFADPLLTSAVQPTQTLNLLEDATVLSSLIKIVRFIAVDCGTSDETEEMETLTRFKQIIEQQISFNTSSGDTQSYINPQSPNNIVYLPKVNGATPIEITDLNLRDDAEGNDKLLEYYQDKKLSVLGVPKEAMNFSSSEGLGGAGAVMSQRSALYANSLQRIETAYINGWTDAINKYFQARNLPQYVNMFELHMNPILTEMSTIQFDKRDSAIGQASSIVELLESLGNMDSSDYKDAITEILADALPKTGANVQKWNIDVKNSDSEKVGF